jgi:hypothetical protein
MKRIVSAAIVLAGVLMAVTATAPAQVPSQMHYQGYVSNSEGGSPLDTNLSMTFTIYNHPTGSDVVWTEIQPSVTISEGLFNVLLGSVNPITEGVFLDSVRWLGIMVDPDPEIVPRTKLATAPYAFRVSTIDGASGGEIFGDVQLHSNLAVGEQGGDAGRIEVTDGDSPVIVADGAGREIAITGKLRVESSSGGVKSNWNVSAQASAAGPDTNVGIWGHAAGENLETNYGIYGSTGRSCYGWAGYFAGNVRATGHLFEGGSGFCIDHPDRPENRYLYHCSVESPDMKNVYDGVISLDASGEAIVELPGYFESLNMEFRYQLTCLGEFAPVYIAREISGNSFAIAGGKPGMKVSWQVTGIRKDPFAGANRIHVEVDKPAQEQGAYLHPEAYGLGEEYGIDYQRHKRMQEMPEKKGD